MTTTAPNGDDPHDEEQSASRILAITAGVAALAVLVVSFAQGPPDKLPDIALGWPFILYVERAGLIAFGIMGLGGLGYRLWRGDQVTQAGGAGANVGVSDTKPAEALKEALDAGIRGLDERLAEVEHKVADDPRNSKE